MSYDQSRIADLLKQCADPGLSNVARGNALEELAAELFDAVPGVSARATKSLDVFDSQEIDVGLWNEALADGLAGFDQIILLECKNWDKPVGSLEVAWFDTKLRLRGLGFGVLIAMNGITGNQHALTAAHQIVAAALSEKRCIVVLRREDLESLTCPADLVEMLKVKRLEATLRTQI